MLIAKIINVTTVAINNSQLPHQTFVIELVAQAYTADLDKDDHTELITHQGGGGSTFIGEVFGDGCGEKQGEGGE
jgi:hypothetical protein